MKGWRPRGDSLISVVIVLGVVELVGVFGYLGGQFSRDAGGGLALTAFRWDLETAAYTIAMWGAGIGIVVLLALSDEDANLKLGVGVFASLPILLFVVVYFELIELAPAS